MYQICCRVVGKILLFNNWKYEGPTIKLAATDSFKILTGKVHFTDEISIIQGDSGKILNSITNKLKKPAIFWLDGHYSSGITANESPQSFAVLKGLVSWVRRQGSCSGFVAL